MKSIFFNNRYSLVRFFSTLFLILSQLLRILHLQLFRFFISHTKLHNWRYYPRIQCNDHWSKRSQAVQQPYYAILNWNVNRSWNVHKNTITMYCGVSNIFDTYYTTYSDWSAIPQVGRNFSINLQYIW